MLTLLLLWSTMVTAQDAPQRTVVLSVSGGGTEMLVAEIAAIPIVEVREQGWFLEQVRERKLRAKKLLSRPKDLRFVMSGSNILWVVYVELTDDGYAGRIFGSDGELATSTELGDEFGQVEAAQMRGELEKLLGIEAEVVEAIEVSAEEVEEQAVSVGEPEVVTTEEDEAPRPSAPADEGLFVYVGGRFFQRDLSFAGANNAVLNYESAFYPGFALAADYVLGTEVGPGKLGLGFDLQAGFDGIDDASVLHLDAGLGVGLHFGTLNVSLGARHIRYGVSDENVFPSLSHTMVLLGLRAAQPLGPVTLTGDSEVYPWGTYGGAGKAFGESSREIGFASRLGLRFALTDSFDLGAGYGFRVGRSSFAGQGTLDFVDSRGFELVHGPELGVTWHP